MSIKTLNALPIIGAELVTDKKYFISALKRYLTNRSFYSVDGYLLTGIKFYFSWLHRASLVLTYLLHGAESYLRS